MATPAPLACKCCSAPAPWYGAADFNKTCEDPRAAAFPPAGWAVDYHRCSGCGFMFTTFLDDWPQERVQREIYNDDYVKADPEFVTNRPTQLATGLEKALGAVRQTLHVVDYGGGTGELARQLRARGFTQVDSIDPFHGAPDYQGRRIDLMLCFEVLEHLSHPDQPFAAAADILKPHGAILFSTLLQPTDIDAYRATWWYAAPRNGHISLHTRQSLEILTHRHGFQMGSFDPGVHMAWRGEPAFAAAMRGRTS